MIEAYPLQWPDGWPRTPSERRTPSRFKTTPDSARRNLLDQVRMLGGRNAVISSDVPVRQDGQFYADLARRIIRDPGVAIYFTLKGRQMAMACDLYRTPHENTHSLGHAIEHMRGVERHGGGVMMERAFTGFAALPAPQAAAKWWEVLGVSPSASREEILAAHRRLTLEHHPDKGGSPEKMAEINAARDAALSAPVS